MAASFEEDRGRSPAFSLAPTPLLLLLAAARAAASTTCRFTLPSTRSCVHASAACCFCTTDWMRCAHRTKSQDWPQHQLNQPCSSAAHLETSLTSTAFPAPMHFLAASQHNASQCWQLASPSLCPCTQLKTGTETDSSTPCHPLTLTPPGCSAAPQPPSAATRTHPHAPSSQPGPHAAHAPPGAPHPAQRCAVLRPPAAH